MRCFLKFAPWRLVRVAILVCGCLPSLFACAPIQGYPLDPEITDATLKNLGPYFNGREETNYINAVGDGGKTPIRDAVVYARIRGYDIEFSDFEKSLYSQSNGIAFGSDLVGLILGGLTATTGNAATKAALGAASVGVIGANAAINKDLYYQKTIIALMPQMEANRAGAKLPIVKGLILPDSKYNLFQAYSDLDAYKNAGSIPAAISAVTQNAENQKADAQQHQTLLKGISLETPAVSARYDILTNYISGLVAKQDATTLGKIADALSLSVPPGSTYLQIKGIIVGYLYEAIDSKTTEADKLAELDQLATKLKPYVTF
jgi:hypothetical protein